MIRAGVLKLGGGMLEKLLAADPGYRGPRVDCGNGHQAEFTAYRDKVIDAALGPVTLTRAWYHCAACGHGLAPRDAELGVAGGPSAAWSPTTRSTTTGNGSTTTAGCGSWSPSWKTSPWPSPTSAPAARPAPAEAGRTPYNTVDAARLTRGQPRDQQPFSQVTAKCEVLSRSEALFARGKSAWWGHQWGLTGSASGTGPCGLSQ